MNKPKICFLDIETSPNIVTAFDIKNKNPMHHQNIQQERYIICVSYKLQGFKKVYSVSVDPQDPTNDRRILHHMQILFKKVDAVAAHYGDGFDLPFINTRLAYYGFEPLAPVVQIDTYKMAKQKFLFNSNKLDYLGQYLGLGKKKSIGYSTWLGCMAGNKKDLNLMVSYNKRDVVLLEDVYNRLEAFNKPAINHTLFSGKCEHCGGPQLSKQGIRVTRTRTYQRYQCQDCGGWQ